MISDEGGGMRVRVYIMYARARAGRDGYRISVEIFGGIRKKQYLCSEIARSSAVGSAPRSGRGGRAFESPLLDKNKRTSVGYPNRSALFICKYMLLSNKRLRMERSTITQDSFYYANARWSNQSGRVM